MLLCAAALQLATGCGPPPAMVSAGTRTGGVLGVWDLVEQIVDSDGDERIERHEWQLQEHQGEILGFWNRSRTWISGDGTPFACSARPSYTESWRYLFRGRARDDGVQLVVTRRLREAGSCQGSEPPVERCVLRPRGRSLLVHCGRGWLALHRRLDSPVPLELAQRRPGDLTGIWTWNLSSTDAEGDLKLETETWQLRQRGHALEGLYDRVVTVRSRDGRRFQCNQSLAYSSRARFRVRGHVDGQRLVLEEVGFQATPNACETGYRSLDRYQGSVDEQGAIITLSWGRGAQLLYRRY